MQRKIPLTEVQIRLLGEVERDLRIAKERKDLVLAAYLAVHDIERADVEILEDALLVEDGKPELSIA